MTTVVVGAGVVGLAVAHRLASAGEDVVVLDSGVAGAGASHGNAAKVALAESAPVPAPGVLLQGIRWMLKADSPLSVKPSLAPDYVKFMMSMARHCTARSFQSGLETHLRLAATANELFDDYVADGVEYEMHRRGVLLAFETEERYREHSAQLETLEGFGMVPRRLVGAEVQEAEPALADRIGYGLHFPDDRQIQPDSLVAGLMARCAELGVTVREHTAVTSFSQRGGTVTQVHTEQGEAIDADAVVLAAGSWSRPLAKSLGAPLPVHGGKGYSIDYRPGPVPLQTSLTLEDARVAVTPLDGMVRLAGTMEFGREDSTVDPVRVEAIRRAAAASLRGWTEADLAAQEQEPWSGLRAMTPDGLPAVGRLGTTDNAYAATGHSMLGLTLAPVTAEIIADQVLQRRSSLAEDVVQAVSPQRFLPRRSRRGRQALQGA